MFSDVDKMGKWSSRRARDASQCVLYEMTALFMVSKRCQAQRFIQSDSVEKHGGAGAGGLTSTPLTWHRCTEGVEASRSPCWQSHISDPRTEGICGPSRSV